MYIYICIYITELFCYTPEKQLCKLTILQFKKKKKAKKTSW